jgi:integrase/recombinase XerD
LWASEISPYGSKVILRHSNLSTTQRYLGKITDTEAMKWIENLYG